MDTTSVVSLISGGVGIGAAVFERVRNIKLNTAAGVSIAKDELVKVLQADRDAWKARHDGLNGEYLTYREAAHKKDETTQARMLALNEEVGNLRAKTDMTPVMKTLQEQAAAATESRTEQAKINAAVLSGLEKQGAALEKLVSHIDAEREHRREHHA